MNRRDFLHVGFCGGIGLTLAQYFKLQSAKADIKNYESKEGSAKSVIFIFLPGAPGHFQEATAGVVHHSIVGIPYEGRRERWEVPGLARLVWLASSGCRVYTRV